jgi:hypothetical protein
VPQLLLLVFEPGTAMLVTLVMFASLGASGCFVLLRRNFGATRPAATFGAILFLLNGFMFYRMVIGHITYHAFGVAPLLACVVASTQTVAWTSAGHSLRRLLVPITLGGLLVGYITYGGALNFQIPIVLTVASVLLLLQIERGVRAAPWLVLAGSCLWGVAVSAMKLLPAVVLAGQFPRTYLPYYLFRDPLQLAAAMFVGLFAPGALPDGLELTRGVGLGRHEFEFGLSVVPAALIFLLFLRGRLPVQWLKRRMLWLVLGAVLLTPVALSIGPHSWGALLLHVPVLNSNTTFVRWWAIYLMPLVIVATRCIDTLADTRSRRIALLGCCAALAIGQEALHNPTYYTAPGPMNAYDPKPVTNAYQQLQAGRQLPPIDWIGWNTGSARERPSGFRANDAVLDGVSALPCYEPLFGYEHEHFPPIGLVSGPIAPAPPEQRLNLVDPSNYFHRPIRPAPDWRFETSRLTEARMFASYRPYEWPEPWWHTAATRLTVATLLLSLVILLFQAGRGLLFRLAGRSGN